MQVYILEHPNDSVAVLDFIVRQSFFEWTILVPNIAAFWLRLSQSHPEIAVSTGKFKEYSLEDWAELFQTKFADSQPSCRA